MLILALAACSEPPSDEHLPSPTPPAPPVFEKRAPLEASIAWPKLDGQADAPMSLTASDGTGLKLVSMEFKAHVQDPLAFTELHLEFDNPESRTIEGRFEITLPPGASVSRFAMEIGGSWQEGEVVELSAARRAYEDFLHRKQDPALLEAAPGNRFSARVFPILPNARKKLILSFSHEMTEADAPYRLMLRGLPHLDRLDGTIIVDGWGGEPQTLSVREQDFTPEADLEVQLAGDRDGAGLRSGDLAVARVSPMVDSEPQWVRDLTILFDTSASRALGLEEQVYRLSEMIRRLDSNAQGALSVEVLCFDQELWSLYDGPASGYGAEQEESLLARGALGASDLGAALEALEARGEISPRLLVITDGVFTAGPTESGPLEQGLRALEAKGLTRADMLVSGGIRDEAMLRSLATPGLPQDGVVLDAAEPISEIVRRMSLATRSGVEVIVRGAEWVWPAHLDGLQAGDDVLVYAKLPPNAPFDLSLAGADPKGALSWAEVERPLLVRAAVRADIERLNERKEGATSPEHRAELQQQILALSLEHRVLTSSTALLVLERDSDYARFGLDRNALTDILVVGAGGVETHNRGRHAPLTTLSGGCSPAPPEIASEPVATTPAPSPADAIPEAEDAAAAAPDANSAPASPRQHVVDTGAPTQGAPPAAPSPAPSPSPAPALAEPPPAADEVVEELAEAPALARREEGKAAKSKSRPSPRPSPSPRPAAAPPAADPYTGKLADIMRALSSGDKSRARKLAEAWREDEPGDVLALIGLGEVNEAVGDKARAARAYGSIIDLFPDRADLRRMAGERLERLGDATLPLAADTYAKAVLSRPDHPHGHRLLAYALLRLGRHREALDVLEAALRQSIPSGRFAAWDTILREDLGLVAAAWLAQEPDKAVQQEILSRVGSVPSAPSLRFVLVWETDANDVDFHIHDGRGGHAFYGSRELRSGGSLYADVTTGYGPECFTIEGKPSAYPYTLQAHYYSRGPMGYGMGKLEVLEHDGRGGLRFDERPFLIMQDGAFVDLGRVKQPL